MPQDKVKVLYDAVSKDYDIGSEDEFRQKLANPEKQKAFYEGVGKEYALGTFDEFVSKIAPEVKKKESTTPTSSEPAKTPQLGYGSLDEALKNTQPITSTSKSTSESERVKTVPPPLGIHPDNLKIKNTGKSIEAPTYDFDAAVKKSEEENKVAKEESIKNNSITQTPDKYYWKGVEYPISDYTEHDGTLYKKNPESWTNTGEQTLASFGNAVVKPIAGATKLFSDVANFVAQKTGLDKIKEEHPTLWKLNPIKLAETSNALGKLSSNIDFMAEQNPMPNTVAGNVVKSGIDAAPLIATMAFMPEAKAVDLVKLSLDQLLEKSATGTLTKVLATQGALNTYGESRKSGKDVGESLGNAVMGGIEGGAGGAKLEMGMGLSGRLTAAQTKALGLTNKLTSSLVSAANTGLVLGGSSTAEKIASGQPVNFEQITTDILSNAAFGIPEIAGAIKGEVVNHKLNGRLAFALQNDNAVQNFLATPIKDINKVAEIQGSHQDLMYTSMLQGMAAHETKDLNEKQGLYTSMLNVRKASDIKYVVYNILKDKEGFIKGIEDSQLSDEQKAEQIAKVEQVYKDNQPLEITKRKINNDIKDLVAQKSELEKTETTEPIDGIKKEIQIGEINKAIKEKEARLTALVKGEPDTLKPATKKQIGDFIEKMNSADDLTPEETDFYNHNKTEIEKTINEAKKNEKIPNAPATEISSATETKPIDTGNEVGKGAVEFNKDEKSDIKEKELNEEDVISSRTIFNKPYDDKNLPNINSDLVSDFINDEENAKRVEVDIKDLIPTQRILLKDTKSGSESEGNPFVIKDKNGRLLVVDGHHRIADAVNNGKAKIKVDVYDISKLDYQTYEEALKDKEISATPQEVKTTEPKTKGDNGVPNSQYKEGEIQPAHKMIKPVKELETLDMGEMAGKKQDATEKERFKEQVLNEPDKKFGKTGESANEFLFGRVLPYFEKVLSGAKDNTTLVTHSSVLKAMKVLREMNYPDVAKMSEDDKVKFRDLYVNEKTEPSDIETFKGAHGEIHVSRHGQTEDNIAGNYRHPNTKLTEQGIKDAQEAAKKLKGQIKGEVPAIITSDFDRAIHTANIIHKEIASNGDNKNNGNKGKIEPEAQRGQRKDVLTAPETVGAENVPAISEKKSADFTETPNLTKIEKATGKNWKEIGNTYAKYGDGKPLDKITPEDFKKAQDKQEQGDKFLNKLESLKEKEEENKLSKNPKVTEIENQLSDLNKRLQSAPIRFKKGGELSQKSLRAIITNVKQQLREARGTKPRKTEKVKSALDKLDLQTEDDFIAQKLAGIRISTKSFEKVNDKNNITGALRLKYLSEKGEPIDKVAQDLINEGGIFENADAKDVEKQIAQFMVDNHSPESYAKKMQDIPDYEQAKYDEEAAYAEQQVKDLDEKHKTEFFELEHEHQKNTEEFINSLTDEEFANIVKDFTEGQANENQILKEIENGNQDNFFNDYNFPPRNDTQTEHGINKDNRRQDEAKTKVLDQKIKDAKSVYQAAEKKYLDAKAKLDKNGQQDQVNIFGKTPAESLLIKNDLKSQQKVVDNLKSKTDEAKKELTKALSDRENFVSANQVSIFDKTISALDSMKIDTKNTLNAFGIAPKIWNASIDLVKAALTEGKHISEAIQRGAKYLKSQIKDFDEKGYIAHMNEQMGVKSQAKELLGEEEKKTTGVSKASQQKRAEELGVEPAKRGIGTTPKEILKKGQELLSKGADAEKVAEEYKKTGKISIDDFNVLTSHADELAKQTNLIEDKFGIDSKEYKDALQKELDWNKEIINPIANEFFHQTGMRLQADVEIDTGSYSGIKKAIEKQTGKPATPDQVKQAKVLSEKVKSLTAEVESLKSKLDAAIQSAITESEKSPTAIKDKAKQIAANIRKGKLSRPDIFSAASPASIVWDGALEAAAKTVEKGGDIAQAIADGLKHIEDSDWYQNLGKNDKDKAKKGLTDYFDNTVNNTDIQTRFVDKKDSKFTLDEVKAIWDYAKSEYLDKGKSFQDMLKGMSEETGLNTSQIRNAISTPKSARVITDEMYVKQARRRSAISAAKRFVDESNKTILGKVIGNIPSFFFKLKTFGHGTVGGVTHAGANIFRPSEWKHYIPFFVSQFKYAFGSTAKYEQAMEDLKLHPDFIFWKRAGLAVDPTKIYDDYQGGKNFFSKWGEAGDRGFNALKVYRLDLAKKIYDNLSDVSKADPETAKTIAQLVNHSTGTHDIRIPKWVGKVIFAPSLEASKWSNLIIDPAKAAYTFAKWNKATPAKKAAAKIVAKRAGEMLATYSTLLAANAAFNSYAYGDDEKYKVNYNNPLKSDFGKFKIGGKDWDISGGMLPTIRFISSLVHESIMAYNGVEGQREQPQEKDYLSIMQQVRYKLSPFASTAVDIKTGTDAMGKPLPFSKVKGKFNQDPYTFLEYILKQQTPIPVAEGIKVTMDEMEAKGMTKPQIKDVINGIYSAIISGGTGAKVRESQEPKSDNKTEENQKKRETSNDAYNFQNLSKEQVDLLEKQKVEHNKAFNEILKTLPQEQQDQYKAIEAINKDKSLTPEERKDKKIELTKKFDK